RLLQRSVTVPASDYGTRTDRVLARMPSSNEVDAPSSAGSSTASAASSFTTTGGGVGDSFRVSCETILDLHPTVISDLGYRTSAKSAPPTNCACSAESHASRAGLRGAKNASS